jgi:uncharacterized protein with beta-barrel porin domain
LRFGRESLILAANFERIRAERGKFRMQALAKAGLRAAARLAAVAFACAFLFGAGPALAQGPTPTDPATSYIHLSSTSSLFDLSTRFMRHLGTEAANSTAGPPLVSNPQGSGADLAVSPQQQQRWRTWFEGYGQMSRMSAQDAFPGDRRRVWGGVAGVGYTAAPGVSFGASVDQSRTKIDIVSLPQSAFLDITQVGVNAAFDSGPWTLGIAGIHGFGSVKTRRDDIAGLVNTASYDARLWGAFAELSYLWSSGNFRVVPKAGADWARSQTASFIETGGPGAVTGSDQTSSRTRIFGGAEIGHTWIFDRSFLDLSAYGRGVYIVQQNISALQVDSDTTAPISVQGVGESRIGADAGATATYRLSAMTRVYASYDGRFRSNFTSHTGTAGIEFRW